MNKVQLTGRFVRDVEVNTTQSGTQVGRTSIAVTRNFKGANGEYESDFINLIFFGKTTEFAAKYFQKGSAAEIVGRIQTGSYENKDGKRVYTTDVIVEEVKFGIGGKSEGQKKESYSKEPDFAPIDDSDETSLPFDL